MSDLFEFLKNIGLNVQVISLDELESEEKEGETQMTEPTGLKNLTSVIVEAVFYYLLLKNGKTTSLEVKEELRSMGFRANQSDISEVLKEETDEQNEEFLEAINAEYIEVYNEGTHKIYTLVLNENAIEKPESEEKADDICERLAFVKEHLGDFKLSEIIDLAEKVLK